MINQTAEVHEKIVKFLEDLRRQKSFRVSLQARLFIADADAEAKLGVNADTVTLDPSHTGDFWQAFAQNAQCKSGGDLPDTMLFS